MNLDLILFVFHLAIVANVPVEYSTELFIVAGEYGVDEYDAAALLISEHSGPTADFSVVSSVIRGERYEWNPLSTGSANERGLFQVIPYWASKAELTVDELWEPSKNIRAGVVALAYAHESHDKCKDRKRFVFHDWIAHWKCNRNVRDNQTGQCRFAQRKYEKVRTSLDSFWPVNLKAIGASHNKRYTDTLRRATKYVLRNTPTE